MSLLSRLSYTLIAGVVTAASGQAAASLWSVVDHGAVGDGTTVNTTAIQATIEACAAAGGGTVEIPPGIFLTGAVFFKPGVNLQIDRDGVLKGTTNLADYPLVKTRWEGTDREWTAALLNFFDMQNFSVAGEGLVDGSGTEFPRYQRAGANARGGASGNAPAGAAEATSKASAGNAISSPQSSPLTAEKATSDGSSTATDAATGATGNIARAAGASASSSPTGVPRRGRPRTLAIQNCQHVRISNLHFKDEASWCVFMLFSEDVAAENLNIRADHTIPSSDGIDIDSCNHVHIIGCDIDVNDDCISIKSGKDEEGRRVNRPAENILIEKTRFGYGHGGVAMGSEVSGGIRHVEVRDCVVEEGNWAAVRFKSQPSRGGVIEDIVYRNIAIHDARMAVEFNLAWRLVPPLPPAASPLTEVRGVKLINVSGTAKSAGSIRGLPDGPIRDVTFTDCHLEADTGLTTECIQKLDTEGLNLHVKSGPEILRK